MSTALSRLNSFLDSELEQLLCFDTEIDAEKFCNEKSAIFVINAGGKSQCDAFLSEKLRHKSNLYIQKIERSF